MEKFKERRNLANQFKSEKRKHLEIMQKDRLDELEEKRKKYEEEKKKKQDSIIERYNAQVAYRENAKKNKLIDFEERQL